MARSRNIKPGFFKNEDLSECSLAARLCFAGLWTLADREGRLEDRPKRIKGELFPFDSFDVEPLLSELSRHGFIVRYEIDGQRCIQVSRFSAHQTPHYTEKPSAIKPPKLQESSREDATKDSKNTPGVVPPSRGGQNPLIPDSLIPDSLKKKRASAPPVVPPGVLVSSGFSLEVATEFIAHKARLKAPLTERAWKDHLREASKAGWTPQQAAEKVMAKNWKGFEADYVAKDSKSPNGIEHVSATPTNQALPWLQEQDRRKAEYESQRAARLAAKGATQ